MTIIEVVFDGGESKLLGFYRALKSSEQDKLSWTDAEDLSIDCELLKD